MLYTTKTFPFEHSLKEAEIVLLGIPWDSTETGKSVKYGPLFIREALRNTPEYDLETKTDVFERFKFTDLGDIEVVQGNWNLSKQRIKETIKEIKEENTSVFPIFLGGDHLISLGILKALAEKEKITVIDFDAHRDLMDNWIGEKHSHITWAKRLLEEKNFDLVQIGCRSSSKEEENFVEKNKISDSIEKIKGKVYLSVDLDVFDPMHAPEVGTPELLGMNPKEFFLLLKKICEKEVIGLDLVECSADKVNTQTANLAANIIKKFLAYKKS